MVTIDGCAGVIVYLSQRCVDDDISIVTSKCSELNVVLPPKVACRNQSTLDPLQRPGCTPLHDAVLIDADFALPRRKKRTQLSSRSTSSMRPKSGMGSSSQPQFLTWAPEGNAWDIREQR
mmetsp:Transcript_16337/g.25374  ORF Transcript_16337/g.25374 Transcript_16337/m.25374 type:complete len:120 (-) Transcript_16337:83-442(-)